MDPLPPSESLTGAQPEASTQAPPAKSNKPPKTPSLISHYVDLKKTSTKIIIASVVFLTVFLLLLILLKLFSQPETPVTSVTKTKTATNTPKKATESTTSLTPEEKLQTAYDDVIGSEDVKKTLLIDSSGIATIEYTIPSADGQVIIKTSYENFADFAVKVFNIESVTALHVTTYANRFTDKFGQPDQPALKLQVTKATNDKINWPLKKFVYKDYPSILDFHEMNSLLQKDYEKLLQATSRN